MKTRNGFVSNSSSSSFVVAFPKKPKNPAEVWEIMFGGKDVVVSCYDNGGLSYSDIASRVFHSLESNKFKKATLKDIVEEFNGRYRYYPKGHNVFWDGRTSDEYGGAWTGKIGPYYGSDEESMEDLKKHIIQYEEKIRKLNDMEREVVSKSGLNAPQFAYAGGVHHDTNKPYTKNEIARYEAYMDALAKFKEKSKEYKKLQEDRRDLYVLNCKVTDKHSSKVAECDAQNFLNDNKGMFVFIVEYSDDSSDVNCTMEHGEIFRNVSHVRISKH
jgi:hypothetical protein